MNFSFVLSFQTNYLLTLLILLWEKVPVDGSLDYVKLPVDYSPVRYRRVKDKRTRHT